MNHMNNCMKLTFAALATLALAGFALDARASGMDEYLTGAHQPLMSAESQSYLLPSLGGTSHFPNCQRAGCNRQSDCDDVPDFTGHKCKCDTDQPQKDDGQIPQLGTCVFTHK